MSADVVQRHLDELKHQLAKQFKKELDSVFDENKDNVGGARDRDSRVKNHTSDLQTALNQTKEDNDALQSKNQRSQRTDGSNAFKTK